MTIHRAAAQDHNGDDVRARTWSWASNVTTWLSIAVAGMIIVFIGLAIGLKPTAARFDLFVPADTVKVVRGMLGAVGGKNKDD